jgi:hypothetical protein
MITLVFAYYNNPKMLLRHLQEWQSYDKELRDQLRVIIVDDASAPENTAYNAIEQFGSRPIDMRVYQVLKDIPWNQDGARNLAMRNVETEWALMMDMDHLLPPLQAAIMLEFEARQGTYYMPNQYLTNGVSLDRPHPNGYLFNVRDFWMMGGYDEDFAGYYGSDGNFRRCAKGAGLIEKPIFDFHTVVYRSEDIHDANTKGLGRKGSVYHSHKYPHLAKKMQAPPYRAVNPIRFPYKRMI